MVVEDAGHRGHSVRQEALARKLGADDLWTVRPSTQSPCGARAVLATVTSAGAMTSAIDGLAVRGRLIVIGVDAKPIEVSPLQLISASRSIVGHAGASLALSSLSGVRPIIEMMQLAQTAEAYDCMMRGDARFRRVLTMA